MAQALKEIGFLWAFFVSCLLINADERGKRFLLELRCDIYTEYKELLALENDGQCHSFDSVIHKLRDLQERSHYSGPHCAREVIGKMKYYFSHHSTSGGCKCSGHVAYHPDKYHNGQICGIVDHDYNVLYADLFGSDSKTGPCLPHNEVWVRLNSLPRHQHLDCQWEIISHYITIFDANGPRCNCSHVTENMNVNVTPSHTVLTTTIALADTTAPITIKKSTSSRSTTTTISLTTPESVPTITVLHPCTKVTTISILAHGFQQSNPNAGNCHLETNDHQAPEALVMNMCNVAGAPETWTSGQNVMSVCASIPLYTPVATFFHGKYQSQGGHVGIFIGCTLNGFKIIVQECDQNITVTHVTTGHLPDPVNYFIIM